MAGSGSVSQLIAWVLVGLANALQAFYVGLLSVAIRSACFLPTKKACTSNNVFPFFVGRGGATRQT